MDYFTSWQLEVEDLINIFLDSELDISNSENLVAALFGQGVYTTLYAPMSVTKMIFLHGNQDVNYPMCDTTFMEYGTSCIMYSSLNAEKIFVVQIEEDCYQKEIAACALIKLLNKAFQSNNIFIFKSNTEICIGCKRSWNDNIINNFCLSNWFKFDDYDNLFEIFIDDYEDIREINYTILEKSIYEKVNSYYDKYEYDPEYVFTITETGTFLNINVQSVILNYINSFIEEEPSLSYRLISERLKYVAEEEMISSYETLELAEQAVESNRKLAVDNDFDNNTSLIELDETTYKKVEEIPASALDNAEILLKHISSN